MSDSSIINLSGYRFVHLHELERLQAELKEGLLAAGVKGAVILAEEGINVTLAGLRSQTDAAIDCLDRHALLKGLWLKESLSQFVPHKRLRVRVRTEIIAFDGDESMASQALRPTAPAVSPNTLDNWLDEHRNITLLDTRNDYEIVSGTFDKAVHLDIKHFRHFKDAVRQALKKGELDRSQPLVTFCTCGIRCEKAAPWLMAEGFEQVYQIEGGLINYLQQSKKSHWQGDCFVFDDRVELTPELEPTGAGLCDKCQLAVPKGSDCKCQLGVHFHATYQASHPASKAASGITSKTGSDDASASINTEDS